jgi:hypothetical protein
MTLEHNFELALLKRHLQKHPEQATTLAVAHFEDYLVLLCQYEKLLAKVKQLRSNNIDPKFISLPNWSNVHLTLEREFAIAVLKLQLQQFPFLSFCLAISYFCDFLLLTQKYMALQTEFFCHKL